VYVTNGVGGCEKSKGWPRPPGLSCLYPIQWVVEISCGLGLTQSPVSKPGVGMCRCKSEARPAEAPCSGLLSCLCCCAVQAPSTAPHFVVLLRASSLPRSSGTAMRILYLVSSLQQGNSNLWLRYSPLACHACAMRVLASLLLYFVFDMLLCTPTNSKPAPHGSRRRGQHAPGFLLSPAGHLISGGVVRCHCHHHHCPAYNVLAPPTAPQLKLLLCKSSLPVSAASCSQMSAHRH
jgi:hypothetical protein